MKLKGGTKKTTSEVWAKVKEIKREFQKKKRHTEKFKSNKSAMEVKNIRNLVKMTGKRNGLTNLTNTCYLNAAIQGFQSCTLLRDAIIKAPERDWKGSRLTRRMKVTFLEMRNPDRQEPWAPVEMFNEICTWEQCAKYKNKSQQDAGELIRCLIQKLSEENKTAGKLFSAAQLNKTKCKHCKEETAVEQKFRTIELNISNSETKRPGEEKRDETIEDLLRSYSEWETLTEDTIAVHAGNIKNRTATYGLFMCLIS